MNDEEVKKIADTFYHFDDFYVDLKKANWDLDATKAKGEPFMIEWLLEYLIREEEYEKAAELKNNFKNL